MSRASSLLIAKGVTKTFIKKNTPPIHVLRQVDLEIMPADAIAIIGRSGAGKSTLLHILGTLEAPTQGAVHFLGQDIFQFSEEKLARFRNQQLGFVFQFHFLMLEFTALENVMMPAIIAGTPKKTARERAMYLLSRVGLENRLEHRPKELSGGEQQRVAIARALVHNPKLLLTDEMTGNLDPLTGMRVFDLVQSMHQEFKMALVSVTHDESLAAVFPFRYRLVDGILQREA